MAGKRVISLPEGRRERFLDCQMKAIRLALESTAALLLPLKSRLLTPNSGYEQDTTALQIREYDRHYI